MDARRIGASISCENSRIARLKILVVDDSQDAAESLQLLLTLNGADVGVAHSGPEALSVFEATRPQVVLLDIGMPGMDGYEVARALRATWPTLAVALVAVTGWGEAEDRERTRQAGFDHHFVKPIDFDALKVLIASMEPGTES